MKPPTPPPIPDELTAVLRRMRLPYVRAAAPEVLATARAQRWDPAEVLRVLLVEEIAGRDAATRRQRRKSRRVPGRQDLRRPGARTTPPSPPPPSPRCAPWNGWAGPRTWPWPAHRHRQDPLRRSPRPRRHRRRHAGRLVHPRVAHRHHRPGQGRRLGQPGRRPHLPIELIVVDDIGQLPAGQDAAEAFYRVVDAAYERRSVAVTSNLHPSGFDTIMPKGLATATVDRLMHHAHVVLTEGGSLRLAEALAGKGVGPCT